ncbi:uncharacterized protein LOC141910629 [Tubulanus polymorphus]|uniref:uncharacterized protein LOC141910629 n=1 Tax=Tubulanus polymorphus TaxID=672921 RepID=UPI003DA219E7
MNVLLSVIVALIAGVQASIVLRYKYDDFDHDLLVANYPKYFDFLSKASDGCVTFKPVENEDEPYIKVVSMEACYGGNDGQNVYINYSPPCTVGHNLFILMKYGVKVDAMPDYWKDRAALRKGILSSNKWEIPAEYMNMLKQQYC